jgi:cytochrome c-type biogenesis protein CcsB
MVWCIIVVSAVGAGAHAVSAAGPALTAADLRTIRGLPVQHEGRCCPLDTVARDVVRQITGQTWWHGRDPVLNLLDWTFRPNAYRDEPLVHVSGGEVRRLIGLPVDRTDFSLKYLQENPGVQQRLNDLMRKQQQGGKLDSLDERVQQIGERMTTLFEVFDDDVIRPIPEPNNPIAQWKEMSSVEKRGTSEQKPIREAWRRMREAFVAGDAGRFDAAAKELVEVLRPAHAACGVKPRLIDLELRYNWMDPLDRSWVPAAVAAALALVSMFVRTRWVNVLAGLALALAFALVTYGIGVRWRLAGRIPAANMYESMIFMGWGLGLATLICLILIRNRLLTLVASLMTWIALMLAALLPLDSSIRPVAPVLLDTIWMGIHVPVIMVSYSVLTIAMGFALALLGIAAISPRRSDLIKATDRLQYRFIQVGSVLLTVGIVTGSMWGSASWGRYWGWDPKEVWSLVALLGYMAILHARHAGWLRGFGTALCSTLAFWLIVMTYAGVNFVLGIGLHSYAFGKGAVARWLLTVGCIQMILTALAVLAYLVRRPKAAGAVT